MSYRFLESDNSDSEDNHLSKTTGATVNSKHSTSTSSNSSKKKLHYKTNPQQSPLSATTLGKQTSICSTAIIKR